MSYSLEKVNEIVISSVGALHHQQPMLFQKSDNISERAVSAALQGLLIPHFPKHHVNCEYNRMTDEHGMQIPKRIHKNPDAENKSSVFPDIIVHQQSNGANNLLVIEVKMSWKNDGKDEDFDKLIGYTTELRYQYGLYLELGEKSITEMSWFQNGTRVV